MFRADAEPNRVSIVLFGECHVSVAGRYLSGVPYGFFRIVAFLLLEGRGQPVARRRIGQLMWSESGPAQASADIRQTVARIRRFQDQHGFRFIAADASTLWLAEDAEISCDLVEFLTNLENTSPTASIQLCELYRGELLASLGSAGAGYEEWLSFQRPYIHDEFIDAVSKAILPDSGLTRQQRDFCARRLMKVDPSNEGAYRALMRGAAETGQISMVRHIFEDCTRKLMDELGVGPDEQTVQLFQELTRASKPPISRREPASQ
jgi:DNA-binding SARP family transcriptional activator